MRVFYTHEGVEYVHAVVKACQHTVFIPSDRSTRKGIVFFCSHDDNTDRIFIERETDNSIHNILQRLLTMGYLDLREYASEVYTDFDF